MKRLIILTAGLLCGATALKADQVSAPVAGQIVDGVTVKGITMEHSGRYMTVDMDMDLTTLKVGSNRAVLLTPRIINGNDSVEMHSIGVYGRRRYYYYVRNGQSMLTGESEKSYRASQRPDSMTYSQVLPYEEWMNGATLKLYRSDYGCCGTLLAEQAGMLGNYAEEIPVPKFFPDLVYVCPAAEKSKSRSLEGSAFIDFVVDKTDIRPEYRNNTVELGKIQASIDSVRDDRDVTIDRVWLKGFASPESPYAHNRDLAIGRTKALKDYIRQLYHFDDNVIATDYEPEDWAGLRKRVEASNIDHRKEILDIIDLDMDPDKKEWRIKSTYPEEYRFMLKTFYPALRHTDYRIAYTIRSFNDPDELAEIFRTRPSKLSLNELYLLAQRYEAGSDEFTEVFETAARMYPDDATANLNAANAAMRRGDNESARRYVEKAGNTPEAVYARGSLAIRTGDIETARRYLEQAKAMGLQQAAVTLDELDKGVRP